MSTVSEHAAFVQQLFERYREALRRHVAGLLGTATDAEDIVQETCARLLRAGHLERTETRARSYMFRIATNLAYDRHRQRRELSIDEVPQHSEPTSTAEAPESILEFDQAFDSFAAALLRLPPRSRRVFLLRTAEGLSYEAIAERLSISKRSVERDMHRAMAACQAALTGSKE